MASVRANWHLADLDLPDGDPMQAAVELRRQAKVIDLSKSEGELDAELSVLYAREVRLYEYAKDETGAPLECELKWQPSHLLMAPDGTLSCFACPHYAEDRQIPRALVCVLGRAQEEAVEHLRALRIAGSLEEELCAAHLREIEECGELIEARYGEAATVSA